MLPLLSWRVQSSVLVFWCNVSLIIRSLCCSSAPSKRVEIDLFHFYRERKVSMPIFPCAVFFSAPCEAAVPYLNMTPSCPQVLLNNYCSDVITLPVASSLAQSTGDQPLARWREGSKHPSCHAPLEPHSAPELRFL